MKDLIAIGSIIVCHLLTRVSSQDCTLVLDALEASRRRDQAQSLIQTEPFFERYNFYVTADTPAFGTVLETHHPESQWITFQKANIILGAAEFITLNVSYGTSGKECENLRPYANCFHKSDLGYDSDDLQCDGTARYRQPGGSCNNLQNAKLGTKYTAYQRLIKADYEDCIRSKRRTYIHSEELPSARHIGNILTEFGYAVEPFPSQSVLNVYAGFFGQIITHDVGSKINVQRKNEAGPGIKCCSKNNLRRLPENIRHPACQPIDIPRNDIFYRQFNVRCLNYVSSQVTFSNNSRIGPAEQTNGVSSFLDLTVVYGDDEVTESQLRLGENGQLKTNERNVLPERSPCPRRPCYILGDGRLTQTPMLAQWHSNLLRLHNLIASQISSDDEIAFQEAKRLTIALYQHLIYNQWLPIVLGRVESKKYQLSCDPSKMNCGKYDSDVDPSTTNCFAQGAFRAFHKTIPPSIKFYGPDKKLSMSVRLSDMNSSRMNDLEEQYDDLLRGQTFDPLFFDGFNNQLRDLFAKTPSGMGTDLHSIDIQRARDHGVPPFVDYISYCTNKPARINSWHDLDAYFTHESLEILQSAYESPRDVDLLVGIIGERRPPYGMFGKIGTCIVTEQFRRFKFGDRFFYQWTEGSHPFTQRQLQEIQRFTPAMLLCSVANVESVPLNAFLTPSKTNPIVDCDSIPRFNFALFSKKITINS